MNLLSKSDLMYKNSHPIFLRKFASLHGCSRVFAAVVILLIASFGALSSGCANSASRRTISNQATPDDIRIGMTPSQVAAVVGEGNARLCLKRRQVSNRGASEVWILYIFKIWPLAATWSWAASDMGSTRIVVEFVDGQVSAINF
jgi:hypothetical protein